MQTGLKPKMSPSWVRVSRGVAEYVVVSEKPKYVGAGHVTKAKIEKMKARNRARTKAVRELYKKLYKSA